jgi:hypothetical protein
LHTQSEIITILILTLKRNSRKAYIIILRGLYKSLPYRPYHILDN